MLSAWIIAAVCILPVSDGVLRDYVDVIEQNAFYDEQGRLVFLQSIFLDWNECDRRFDVRAWRLVKHESQVPVRDWRNGGYVVLWHDGESIIRQVRTGSVVESFTQFDPELLAREILPKEMRRELRSLRKW